MSLFLFHIIFQIFHFYFTFHMITELLNTFRMFLMEDDIKIKPRIWQTYFNSKVTFANVKQTTN